MRSFIDDSGREWVATVREEQTPRHHGRWHLVFHPVNEPDRALSLPGLQWQTRETAERTIRTMSETELRRRLRHAVGRVD
ncbi:MAG TPA: hypothetical protein VF188_10420 [Longimicrobiales bacterium]